MVRRVYVDTAWKSKPHTCYDPAEDRFFEVEDLAELAGRYDEVYIDCALFLNMWPQLKALINDGARVFYFAWPWKWKRLRERYADDLKRKFGKWKTDYGDAYVLSRIHGMPKAFAEVTPLDVEFKPLLMRERRVVKILNELYQLQALGVYVEDEVIKDHKKWLTEIREEIVEKAQERIPRFTEIAEKLGLDNDDVNALSALAGLLIYLKWPFNVPSYHKARRFLGLYKPTKDDKRKYEEKMREKFVRRYNGYARRYLNSLTAAMFAKKKIFPPRTRDKKEVLRELLGVLRTFNGANEVEGQDKSPDEARGRPNYCSTREWFQN